MAVPLEVRQCRSEGRGDVDPADRPVEGAAMGTVGAARPGRVDRADEVETGVEALGPAATPYLDCIIDLDADLQAPIVSS